MPYTLSNLLQDIYTALGQLRIGVATGGAAGSLEDSSLAGGHADDEWKGGALFITRAGGEPPEGEFASVAAFEAASGMFTLSADLSAAVQSGHRYGLASAYYPLETMIELANAALRALGDIPLVAEETLVSANGGAYSSILEWTRRRPLRIDFRAFAGDAWRTLHDWDFVPAAPGSPALIIFGQALPAARPVRVWYQAAHPRLAAHDDEIANSIAPELAVAAGAERALHWQTARLSGDAGLAARWQQAKAELDAAKRAFPIWKPQRAARLLNVSK